MSTASTIEELVRETAGLLSRGRPGVVAVGALRGEESAVCDPGRGTVFEIGSVTKTFTALALARLSVRGVVRLDQPLRDLLPGDITVPERGGRAVELVHLACHTSGLPRLPKGMLPRAFFPMTDPYAGFTSEVLLDGLSRTRLRSVPGTRFHYSNLGGGLLGLALARHTGTDYDTLIQSEICRPLGMTDTRVVLAPEQTMRLAPGYSHTGRPRQRWDLAALAGAGGLHSTVPDLLRMARAQIGNPPPELAEAITLTRSHGHPMDSRSTMYLGWVSSPWPPRQGQHRVLYHGGGTGGYRATMAIAPEHQAAVVVLSANFRSVRAGLDLLVRLTNPPT